MTRLYALGDQLPRRDRTDIPVSAHGRPVLFDLSGARRAVILPPWRGSLVVAGSSPAAAHTTTSGDSGAAQIHTGGDDRCGRNDQRRRRGRSPSTQGSTATIRAVDLPRSAILRIAGQPRRSDEPLQLGVGDVHTTAERLATHVRLAGGDHGVQPRRGDVQRRRGLGDRVAGGHRSSALADGAVASTCAGRAAAVRSPVPRGLTPTSAANLSRALSYVPAAVTDRVLVLLQIAATTRAAISRVATADVAQIFGGIAAVTTCSPHVSLLHAQILEHLVTQVNSIAQINMQAHTPLSLRHLTSSPR